jgi:hypothetical protein
MSIMFKKYEMLNFVMKLKLKLLTSLSSNPLMTLELNSVVVMAISLDTFKLESSIYEYTYKIYIMYSIYKIYVKF